LERERQVPRTGGGDGGPVPDADSIEQVRAEAHGILDHVDKVLDSIKPHSPEDYEVKLHQHRQRGGQ